MGTAFELNKIQKLLERENIELALQVDTCVLMKHPDLNNWRTSLDGKVLFILTDMNIIELENIKSRRNKDSEAADKAVEACRSLRALMDEGRIQEGISVSCVGWFINVCAPRETELVAELEEWAPIKEAFKQADTKAMILTRQLCETFPALSLFFLSGDVNLCNIMSARGLPVKLHVGFPMELSHDEVAGAQAKEKPSWRDEIESIMNQMAADSVEVELLLRAKRILPADHLKVDSRWPTSQITLAEGSGSINGLTFEWSLPFTSWDYPFLKEENTEESTPCPSFWVEKASLDFGSHSTALDQRTIELVAAKIAECTFPFAGESGLPCLQDAMSTMKYFFHVQYVVNRLDESSDEDFITACTGRSSVEYFFVADILYAIGCGDGTGEEMEWDIILRLFTILNQIWKVGERKRIVVDTRREQT